MVKLVKFREEYGDGLTPLLGRAFGSNGEDGGIVNSEGHHGATGLKVIKGY